ncbi:MAG TPA: hypothetical protein VGH99_09005 [Pseudonocardia sp.]|jgi:hypothetical protein
MNNPPVGTLLATAARETRDDFEQAALRLVARAGDLAAHASGALAGQVDEWGGQLSGRVGEALTRAASLAGDGLVGLGERLSGDPSRPVSTSLPEQLEGPRERERWSVPVPPGDTPSAR